MKGKQKAQVQGDSSISFDLESMLREEEGEYGDLHSFILNETGEMGEEEDESFEADVFVTDAAVVNEEKNDKLISLDTFDEEEVIKSIDEAIKELGSKSTQEIFSSSLAACRDGSKRKVGLAAEMVLQEVEDARAELILTLTNLPRIKGEVGAFDSNGVRLISINPTTAFIQPRINLYAWGTTKNLPDDYGKLSQEELITSGYLQSFGSCNTATEKIVQARGDFVDGIGNVDSTTALFHVVETGRNPAGSLSTKHLDAEYKWFKVWSSHLLDQCGLLVLNDATNSRGLFLRAIAEGYLEVVPLLLENKGARSGSVYDVTTNIFFARVKRGVFSNKNRLYGIVTWTLHPSVFAMKGGCRSSDALKADVDLFINRYFSPDSIVQTPLSHNFHSQFRSQNDPPQSKGLGNLMLIRRFAKIERDSGVPTNLLIFNISYPKALSELLLHLTPEDLIDDLSLPVAIRDSIIQKLDVDLAQRAAAGFAKWSGLRERIQSEDPSVTTEELNSFILHEEANKKTREYRAQKRSSDPGYTEEIRLYNKDYNMKHVDARREKRRNLPQKKKDAANIKQRLIRSNYTDAQIAAVKVREKVRNTSKLCGCGGRISKKGIHIKSVMHLKWLADGGVMEETDVSGSDTGEDEEKEQVVHKGMENKSFQHFSAPTIPKSAPTSTPLADSSNTLAIPVINLGRPAANPAVANGTTIEDNTPSPKIKRPKSAHSIVQPPSNKRQRIRIPASSSDSSSSDSSSSGSDDEGGSSQGEVVVDFNHEDAFVAGEYETDETSHLPYSEAARVVRLRGATSALNDMHSTATVSVDSAKTARKAKMLALAAARLKKKL